VLLENLTATADYVLEATYVGVPDPVWGERPLGIIKLVPGATEREEDICKFLQSDGVEKGRITKWMLSRFHIDHRRHTQDKRGEIRQDSHQEEIGRVPGEG